MATVSGTKVDNKVAPNVYTAIEKSNSNFHFETYTSKYRKDCIELLSDAFTRRQEPVAAHVSYESGCFQFFAEYYLRETERTGMSTVCIENSTGRAVGVLVVEDLLAVANKSFIDMLFSK